MNPGLNLTNALCSQIDQSVPALGGRIYRGTAMRALDSTTPMPFAAVHIDSENASVSRQKITAFTRTYSIEVVLSDAADLETQIEIMRRDLILAVTAKDVLIGKLATESLDITSDITWPDTGSDIALLKLTLVFTYPDDLTKP